MASLLMLATAAAHDETVDPVREAEEALLAAATAGKQSGDPAVQAATLRNLAVFYRTQGRIEEAANLHESALRLRQRNLGRYHPDVVQSLIDVGQLHLEAGELRKTAQFFRRALRAEQKLRGPDHIATAIHLNNLARVEAMRGRISHAVRLYERELALLARNHGDHSPRLASTLENLAGMLGEQGRTAEAAAHYERAISLIEHDAHEPAVARRLAGLLERYARFLERSSGNDATIRMLGQRAAALRDSYPMLDQSSADTGPSIIPH